MKQIKARFQLVAVKEYTPPYSGTEVILEPIYYDHDSEHYTFTEYTPTGELTMHVTNPNVIDILREYGQFELTFTPIREEPTG